MIFGDICCAAHTFCICNPSNCSVHHSIVKSALPFCFPRWVKQMKCVHHSVQKTGWFLLFACTFCHRENLFFTITAQCIMHLLKHSAVLFPLVSYIIETCFFLRFAFLRFQIFTWILNEKLRFLARFHQPLLIMLESHRKRLTTFCIAIHCTVLVHTSLAIQSFVHNPLIFMDHVISGYLWISVIRKCSH